MNRGNRDGCCHGPHRGPRHDLLRGCDCDRLCVGDDYGSDPRHPRVAIAVVSVATPVTTVAGFASLTSVVIATLARVTLTIGVAVVATTVRLFPIAAWRCKRATWRWWNGWTTFAWKIGQLNGRTVALAEFIRHVKNLSYGGNPTPCALGSPCRGAVRTAPLALARSCVYRNLVLGPTPTPLTAYRLGTRTWCIRPSGAFRHSARARSSRPTPPNAIPIRHEWQR